MGILEQPFLDLDKYIDVEALKSLHADVIEGIVRSKKLIAYYGSGLIRSSDEEQKDLSTVLYDARNRPAQMESLYKKFSDPEDINEYLALYYKAITFGYSIPLRMTSVAGGYEGISYAKHNKDHANVEFFPSLLKFIRTLPMKEIGRVGIFLSPSNAAGRIHTDGTTRNRSPRLHEFIWFRTSLDKKFFVMNPKTSEKQFVPGYSAWFDSMDPHGSDPIPFQSFSIRVDGFFTDDFREKLGFPHDNVSSLDHS